MQRTAIIFGHTSGLGLAISKKLLDQGYRIVGVARSRSIVNSPELTEIAADLTDQTALEQVVERIRDQHADFGLLVYCAGTLTAREIDALNYEAIMDLYRLNLFAPMVIESHLLDLIEENGADVVNVTSSSIIEHYPTFTEYATAKAALAKFTYDLRRRLQDSPARVIEICPSGFTSSIYVNMTGERITRDESEQIQVTDLASLVTYIIGLPKIIEVAHIYVGRK